MLILIFSPFGSDMTSHHNPNHFLDFMPPTKNSVSTYECVGDNGNDINFNVAQYNLVGANDKRYHLD